MEEKTIIFGHKNPDTDAISSALALEYLEKKLGNENVQAVRLGKINKETQYVLDYLGIKAPEYVEDIKDGQKVILVDHNAAMQSPDNIANAEIVKVIDHHAVDFTYSRPIYFRSEPLGCCCSVIYKLYRENNIEIPKDIATLMLSAIASDTLIFKSPTTTEFDKEVVKELEKISGLNIHTYGLEMLKAGTDISDMSAAQILNTDSKVFEKENKKFRISQINTADIDLVFTRKDEFESAMREQINEEELDLFLFAVTDIINADSKVIALGEDSEVINKAFNVKLENHAALLKGVVSRKKQLLPGVLENI